MPEGQEYINQETITRREEQINCKGQFSNRTKTKYPPLNNDETRH